MDKIYSWALKYQAAISMVLAMLAFAALSVAFASEAHGAEIEKRIENHELKFNAKCIRGVDSAEVWVSTMIADWDETPVFMGANEGGRIIITRNSHNPTWSFFIETAAGTCIVTSGGEHFLNDTDGTGQKFPSQKEQGGTEDDRV